MADIDNPTLWKVAEALFAEPRAKVAAVARTGLFVECPPDWPPHLERLTGKSMLDSVALADQSRVIEAWERARTEQAASLVARPRTADCAEVAIHFVDLEWRDGVWLAVLIPSTEPADVATAPEPDAQAADMRPRFARQRKDSLAVILDVDEATTALLGFSREEMIGHRSLEFVHPDDHELAIGSWIELLGAPGLGRRVRLRHRRRDGSYVWFELTNNNLLDHPDFGYVATDMVDITEEMAAHEALRAREQLLHQLTESLPVGIVQVDAGEGVVFANSQLAAWVGRAPQTLADLLAAVDPADVAAAADSFHRVLGGAEQGSAELTLAGEPLRHCSLVVRRLTDAAGVTSGAVGCLTDVTDSLRLRRELRRQAMVDPLTGVLNRAGIGEVLEAATREPGRGVAVMFVDLDRFKAVNDSYGHEIGDRLLVRLTGALRNRCRSGDMIGRMGGDEFIVVCTDIGDSDAHDLLRRFQEAVTDQVFELPDGTFTWSASVGLAWSDGSADLGRNLVAEADGAMYAVKLERLDAALPRPRATSEPLQLPADT